MRIKNIKKLIYHTLAIAGSSLLLVIIIAILTIQNHNREDDLIKKQLKREGITLIRILESSIKNGMVDKHWEKNQIQTLFTEVEKAPDIDYVLFMDSTGVKSVIIQSKQSGNKIRSLKLPQEEEIIVSHIGKNYKNKDIFNVIKHLPPLSLTDTISKKPYRAEYVKRWNNYCSGKYIVVGLKMDDMKAAQKEDVRRAIISAIILLILGSASLYFLFILQNYYLLNNNFRTTDPSGFRMIPVYRIM